MKTDVRLEGKTVCLVPLATEHTEALFEALKNPEVWEYTWRKVDSLGDIEEIVSAAILNKEKGLHLPFLIKDKATGKTIGSTRIGDIDRVNKNVEIGWTWISPEYWGTMVNTECKFLLLQYCFEKMKVNRVQFSVNGQNFRSQKAVERIGAVKEGIFRKHRVKADGSIHDNIFYSIIDIEWYTVKQRLINLLEKKY